MRINSLLWILFIIIMLISTAYAASAIDYFTYRMNFPPGTSRYHGQQINFTGNLTITLPSGFTFINSSLSYSQSGSNYSWQAANLTTLDYTIQSPSSCTEGSIYKSAIYHNSSLIDEFRYVCINDNKIVDYKVEYGHGCGNYLAANEPFISNETAALFNLVRVWNIGSYLEPDEDAANAQITCFYEKYPVRTYGRVEVGYETSRINGTFLWDKISGGYWFRIGVLSQDVSNKQIGENYSVNCTGLSYDFTHHRVVAPFPNYTLEVRSTQPLIKNVTQLGSKDVVTIKNIEKYPIYSIFLDFIVNGFVETNILARLGPGETVTYYADAGTNTTASFIPSWHRNCFTPVYYQQLLTNVSNITINNPPIATSISSFAWVQNTSYNNAFDLDNHFSDLENETLTYSYTGTSNINVTINPSTNVVSFSQPSNWTGIEYAVFSASDSQSTTYSNNATLVVYPSNVTIVNATNITYVTVVSGGGGGRRTVYVPIEPEEPECREIWLCDDWSECDSEGLRHRTCSDLNKCGATEFKPSIMESCAPEPPIVEKPVEIPPFEEIPLSECRLCSVIPFIILIFVILIIALAIPKKQKKEGIKWKKVKS